MKPAWTVKKHKAPQREMAFADEPFALVPQTTGDGDRVAAADRQSAANRAADARRQLALAAYEEPDRSHLL